MTTNERPQPDAPRRSLLAALLAVPAVVAALGLSVLDHLPSSRAESPSPFAGPDSFTDAIARDDVQRVYAFVRAGQNPNDLIPAQDAILTGGRSGQISPLVWAIATNRRQVALMLLSYGTPMDQKAIGDVACLAKAFGNEEIANVLDRLNHEPSPTPCPERKTGAAPLLSFLAESK